MVATCGSKPGAISSATPTARAESGTSERDWALYSSSGRQLAAGPSTTGGAGADQLVGELWHLTPTCPLPLAPPRMVGFTGFGTLGGGDLTLEAGRNAGVRDPMGDAGLAERTALGRDHRGGGIDRPRQQWPAAPDRWRRPAVAHRWRTESESAGDDLQPQSLQGGTESRLNGTFSNLRGSLQLDAGRIGAMGVTLKTTRRCVSSAADLFAPDAARAMGGPVLVLGDAVAQLQARAMWCSAGSPMQAGCRWNTARCCRMMARALQAAGFLWTASTAVDLFSAGGDLAPGLAGPDNVTGSNLWREQVQLVVRGSDDLLNYWLYPSRFSAIAAQGDIKLDRISATPGTQDAILLAPSATGRLDVLAGGSIFAWRDDRALGCGCAPAGTLRPAFLAQQGIPAAM